MLTDTGLLLRAEHKPEVVLQTALDAARTLSGASYAVLYSRKNEGNSDKLRLDRVSGGAPPLLEDLAEPPLDRFLAEAAKSPEMTHVAELPAHPLFEQHAQQLASSSRHAAYLAWPQRLGSLLAIPLRRHAGDLFGVAVLARNQNTGAADGQDGQAHEMQGLPGAFDADAGRLARHVLHEAVCHLEHDELNAALSLQAARAAEAQEQCRATEGRLRQALEINQLGTWRWDAASGLISLDERGAELFGVPPHQSISRNQLRDHLVFREDLSRVPEDLATAVDTGGKYEAEYRIRDQDGNLRWIASRGLPTPEGGRGSLTAMDGTVQDITLRKLQEESLRQSEKLAATGRMAATIAHEINNPLEAVTNLIYLAKTDAGAPPAVQRLLETADAELARVSQIAQQTLGFYRDTTRPVSIDLNALLAAVVDLFGRRMAGKRLRITLDLDPGLTVVGLQGEIRQVVSNLLINAIDASERDAGPIRIRGRHRCRNGCHGVCVMISDQGSGIPSHVRTRLFTPFVTSKESHGTGLGLWVTRGMVEKHGGSVRFRSCTRAPSGTVFCVFLPKSAPAAPIASPGAAVLQ